VTTQQINPDFGGNVSQFFLHHGSNYKITSSAWWWSWNPYHCNWLRY